MTATTSTTQPPPKQASFLRSVFRVSLGRSDVLLASLTINILALALPLVILQVYDRIIPNQATETFVFLVIGLVVAVLLDAVLRMLRTYITTWQGARFEYAISRRAVDRLLGSEIESFEKTPPGTHMERIAAIESLRDFHSGQGLIAVSDLPFVFIFIALIYLIGGDLVLAPLSVVVAAALFAMLLGKKLETAVRRRAELDDDRYNYIFQVLNGVHSVKGLGLEAQMVRGYQAMLAPLTVAVRDTAYLSAVGRAFGPIFSNLAMFSVAAFGAQAVVGGTMTSGALIACTLLAGRAVQPLIRMIGVWVQSQNLKLAEDRLDTLMTLPLENRPKHSELDPLEFQGELEVQDVTVHRGRPDNPVLADVSLHIDPGEIVAVTGPMGSGKAALLDLFAGFLHPDEGTLLLDGHDAKAIDYQALRSRIGYARQQAVLYRGTVQENLIKFRDPEHLHDALEVAHKLGLDQELARMPNGLQTHLGGNASEAFAGSIQQEMSLVRALADEPAVVLFDEANSLLDRDADERLREYLGEIRGLTTVVMITSRPSMIRIADRVLAVRKGHVTEIDAETALSQPAPQAEPAGDAS